MTGIHYSSQSLCLSCLLDIHYFVFKSHRPGQESSMCKFIKLCYMITFQMICPVFRVIDLYKGVLFIIFHKLGGLTRDKKWMVN